MYSLGGFPKVALRGEKISPIVVEIYDVDAEGLTRLNRLEGFSGKNDGSNFYDCSPVETGLGEALIYHIDDGYGGTRDAVPHGDWVKYRKGL